MFSINVETKIGTRKTKIGRSETELVLILSLACFVIPYPPPTKDKNRSIFFARTTINFRSTDKNQLDFVF